MTEKFKVGGMTCVNCSTGIERNVSKLNGVKSVSVSLLAGEMTVDFDENLLSSDTINAVVNKLGYTSHVFGAQIEKARSSADMLKLRFFCSLIFLIPLLYFSMGGMIGLPLPIYQINIIIQFVLASVILIINRVFFIKGIKAVISLSPNMDTLVTTGSLSAFIYSVVMTIIVLFGGYKPPHIFYEASAMVLTLVTLGKWLEELSKRKTGEEIDKLSRMMPKTSIVVKDGKESVVLSAELVVGDVIKLKAGDYVPVDGVVIEGSAVVDKSAITGESLPVEVVKGDNVTSGCIIKNGYLLLRAESVGANTLFSKIVEIVKTAGASKAPVQKFADKVSGVFVPIVTAIAIVTFVVWILLTGDIYYSLNFAISVLVVSCPCALGLATPVAVMVSTGKAASMGVLFKDARAMQNSEKINCILLDKTATITVGKPKVTDFELVAGDKDYILSVASSLEKLSNHPLAESIIEFCGNTDIQVEQFSYTVGKGINGVIDGKEYLLGNLELLPEKIKDVAVKYQEKYDGKTIIFLAGDKLLAVFAVSDYIKDGSKDAVEMLNNRGIKTVMITGDNQRSARTIANEVGISEYVANVLPQDKADAVKRYKEQGYFVAMVGDGINDSPALKTADVGIAIGTGTDIAIDSADVVLVNGNLKSIDDTISLSNKSVGIIKGNLFWAFFYNVVAIPVAAGVFSMLGVVFTPVISSAFMCLSSLFVVSNALRIRSSKHIKTKNKKTKIKLYIEGMMCLHCVRHVKEALLTVDGVKKVEVSLEDKSATVTCIGDISNELTHAVTEKGYKVIRVEK